MEISEVCEAVNDFRKEVEKEIFKEVEDWKGHFLNLADILGCDRDVMTVTVLIQYLKEEVLSCRGKLNEIAKIVGCEEFEDSQDVVEAVRILKEGEEKWRRR